MSLLRRLIRESVRNIILEADHSNAMTTIPNLALSVTDDAHLSEVILDLHDGSSLIASATLKNLTTKDLPCIPETLTISNIHTDSNYQGVGIGDLMLDLIFYYAEFEYGKRVNIGDGIPRGITTDFEGGNTPIINYIISKAISDSSYYEQETAAPYKNKKMDFFNKTVDPNDDCYSELFDNEGVYELIDDHGYSEEEAYEELGYDDENFPIGTTSSWRKRGIESLAPVWDILTSRTAQYHFYSDRRRQFQDEYTNTPTPDEIRRYQKEKRLKERKEPKQGTGKKPKGSGRRLYTDENPKDTVPVKFRTKSDIQKTFSSKAFKSKDHKRQSQIINLVHQRVRAAYQNAKDPETKKRLKRAYEYAKKRKESSKRKTQRKRNKK